MDREDLARIAMRYDTALSRAMLKALGIEPPTRTGRGRAHARDRYGGAAELMAQRHGVSM